MSNTHNAKSSGSLNLAQLLVASKIISQAQADLAIIDQETTGMTLEEVILARGWSDKETLQKITSGITSTSYVTSKIQEPSEQPVDLSYQQSLKFYLKLLEKILGKPQV